MLTDSGERRREERKEKVNKSNDGYFGERFVKVYFNVLHQHLGCELPSAELTPTFIVRGGKKQLGGEENSLRLLEDSTVLCSKWKLEEPFSVLTSWPLQCTITILQQIHHYPQTHPEHRARHEEQSKILWQKKMSPSQNNSQRLEKVGCRRVRNCSFAFTVQSCRLPSHCATCEWFILSITSCKNVFFLIFPLVAPLLLCFIAV